MQQTKTSQLASTSTNSKFSENLALKQNGDAVKKIPVVENKTLQG